GFDLQQDDLRNAPEPSLATNTVSGYENAKPRVGRRGQVSSPRIEWHFASLKRGTALRSG
ncbi:MAG TPA: hypothetical protein PKD54_12925, partial [Pirellulaceae bacterium]|nr:hypothetical protein [Pirellulaceae bacterium]